MKLLICILFLIFAIGPCVKAKSFNFGNFFLGSSKKALDSGQDFPLAASQSNLFDSEALSEYSTESGTEEFNSSSDDIFDFDSQNSSSENYEVFSRSEPDVSPSISNNKTKPEVAATVAKEENNETKPSDKTYTTTSVVSSSVTGEKTTVSELPSTANVSKESTSTVVGEEEEVVLGTTTGATVVLIPKNFFQKSIDWVQDAYTLSILVPITAGVLFATTIIVTVALCRCIRRCCRRRRFKRKPLPDSVKSLRPSDRARLLGDISSDEEF